MVTVNHTDQSAFHWQVYKPVRKIMDDGGRKNIKTDGECRSWQAGQQNILKAVFFCLRNVIHGIQTTSDYCRYIE